MVASVWTEGIASQGFDQYFYIDSLRRGAGLSENKRKFLFTSESVTEGHPDKIADQVSDAVLDAVLKEDPMGLEACETLVTTGLVMVAGEITTKAVLHYSDIARDVIRDVRSEERRVGT